MNISIIEIFTVFWLAAFLWVAVVYFLYRVGKQHRERTMLDQYKHD